jgi:hypothetical protein
LLVVELATDLTGGVDFVGVRVELRRGDMMIGEMSELAPRGQSFITPQRVALFEGLADGTYEVDAAVVDLDGAPVAARRTIVEIHEDLALTVVIAGACRDVECPGPGDDPDATACAGGRCVDPRCSPETPDLCGEVCASDAACPDVAGVSGTCVEGVCLYPACAEGTCEIGCASDGDCPAEVLGDWSACAGFADVCDDTAERTRTRVVFRCEGGMCVGDTSTESEACTRETDGMDCGGRTCDWFGCRYPACSTEGEEPGSCFDRVCSGGVCTDVSAGDTTRPCASRASQEGLTCIPDGSFCQGTCRSGACAELCQYCGGICSVVGCRTGSC